MIKLTINEMLIRLARYPMEERLCSMVENSVNYIKNDFSVDKNYKSNALQPWEMETFLLLCIMANNTFTSNSFNSKHGNCEKRNILNNIRLEMENWERFEIENRFECILTGLANQQFPMQHFNIYLSLYKFDYIFNNNKESQAIFQKKYSANYRDIICPFIALIGCIRCDYFTNSLLEYLLHNNRYLLKNFLIDLDDLINEQKTLTPSVENYKYGFKLFTSYPFIRYNDKIILSLPHTLLPACTDSILIRLTTDDKTNKTRQHYAKQYENYLYMLLKDSNLYTNIIPETIYTKNKKEIKSSDVVFKEGEYMIFLDAKISQANVNVRNLKIDELEKLYSKYADSVIQLYKRISDYPTYFDPFNDNNIDRKNIFGVVVALQDSNLYREKVYNKVFETLKIETPAERDYIMSNIVISEIKQFEDLYLYGFSILPHLLKRQSEKLYNNIELIDYTILPKNRKIKSKDLKTFISDIQNCVNLILNDWNNKRLLKSKNE